MTAKQLDRLENQVHHFTVDGQDLWLTTAQVMELYVLTKQEEARNHLLSENKGKGIVQPEVKGYTEEAGKQKKVKIREGTQALRMNAAELDIKRLSLSPQKKTALAVACGWSYETVMENKLW